MIPGVCPVDIDIRGQVATVAASQHGILTRRQLLRAGLSVQTIDRWVSARRLILVHRGVYALGHVPPSPHARAMAAVLACGPDAVLSHRSAAAAWGLLRHYGPVDVTVPGNRTHHGVCTHRSRLSDADITRQYDIPTTTPARTLLDLADVLDPAALTRAVNDARLRNLLSLDELAAQLRRGRKTAALKRMVGGPARPTRSVFEDRFLRFVDRYRLPRPEVNTHVAGYEVDMLWRPQALIAELDGREYHEIDFEADREKDADLLTHGHRVIRVTWQRLTERPAKEAHRFRTLLA
jgi:very-short-patch-repair endonuclease